MRKKFSDKIRCKVKDVYDSIAGEFNKTRKSQWSEFDYFLEYVKSGSEVLDLGCGNGRIYELLKSKKVDYLGVDNSSGLLDKARENFPDAKFKLGDMVDLDLPDKSFDSIFSIASFHHIPGRKLRSRAVNEMHRVLKADGVLILTVWNLFQFKYFTDLIKSMFSFIIHFGLKYSWNDLWIKWGQHKEKRYYHAFLPRELSRCFKKSKWEVKEFYFVRKGTRVKFWQSFNICLIAKKKS